MDLERNEDGSFIVLDYPVTDNEPVAGVCNGRIVAYWPSDHDGLYVPDRTYIPAMLVSSWNNGHAVAMPCANIKLMVDSLNTKLPDGDTLGSRSFSLKPAKGCWTWIPKA